MRTSQIVKSGVQSVYLKGKIEEGKTTTNESLLKSFQKDYPDAEFVLSSKSISMIKQNLKRKYVEIKNNAEQIDELLNNKGQKLLREKVYY